VGDGPLPTDVLKESGICIDWSIYHLEESGFLCQGEFLNLYFVVSTLVRFWVLYLKLASVMRILGSVHGGVVSIT